VVCPAQDVNKCSSLEYLERIRQYYEHSFH
jgi:hypothetical protein